MTKKDELILEISKILKLSSETTENLYKLKISNLEEILVSIKCEILNSVSHEIGKSLL